jgi:hypothetical protein
MSVVGSRDAGLDKGLLLPFREWLGVFSFDPLLIFFEVQEV